MSRPVAKLLQLFVVLIGIGALVFLLWEPHLEGRNAHATVYEIYFNDPFLAFAYLGSIPFFVAAFQVFQLLGMLAREGRWSEATARPLRIIKYCALAIIGFVALGEAYILSVAGEDRAGGVFMGLLIATGSMIVAATATRLERRSA